MSRPAHARTSEELKKSIKQQILAGDSRHDLERIVRALPTGDKGWFRDSLLEALAWGAAHDRIGSVEIVLAGPMRRRAKQLKSLAAQMQTAAQYAKRLMESSDSGLDGWAVYAHGTIGPQPPDAADWCNSDLTKAMLQCADRAMFVARAFGVYTRRGIKRDRWVDVEMVTDIVRHYTGRTFYPELARLLTDVYETAGRPRSFSADQIRKIVERHPDI